MIYVRRDPALIPEAVFQVAERAQRELELINPLLRRDYIKKKKHVWRAFAKYLLKMSYGKCWYSESPEPQSFFDVDHFRPHGAAKRAEDSRDGGYPWLAFSWENFRISAGRCNRNSTDEETGEVVGKSIWFPVFNKPMADWDCRCEDWEDAVLIDPTKESDVRLVTVKTKDMVGYIGPSRLCVGDKKRARVSRSIELLGLNLPALVEARKKIMRDVEDDFNTLVELLGDDSDREAIDRHERRLKDSTSPQAPYALAARSKLNCLGGADFLAKPETFNLTGDCRA